MPERDPSIHEILIELRNALGYKKANDGICPVYTETAIDAFLSQPDGLIGYANFKGLVNFIEINYKNFVTSLVEVRKKMKSSQAANKAHSSTESYPRTTELNETEQKILEASAFFDSGELYLNPPMFSGVFGKCLSQVNIKDISEYA